MITIKTDNKKYLKNQIDSDNKFTQNTTKKVRPCKKFKVAIQTYFKKYI